MEDDEQITNIDEAKRYFQSMGCSHFHMYREIPQRYREYRGMNIPKSSETEWTREKIFSGFVRLNSPDTPTKDLWAIHSSVSDLLLGGGFVDLLQPLLDASSFVEGVVRSLHDRLVMAETIVGRQDIRYRSGLIFKSHDSHRNDLAVSFAGLSRKLSEKPFTTPADEERRWKLLSNLNQTVNACGIKASNR